jgi:hypothetical protein
MTNTTRQEQKAALRDQFVRTQLSELLDKEEMALREKFENELEGLLEQAEAIFRAQFEDSLDEQIDAMTT